MIGSRLKQVKLATVHAPDVVMIRIPAVLVALVGLGGLVRAAPLQDSRIGGLALAGPASQHSASVFYNPAAASLLSGHHLYLDGTLRLGLGEAALRPIDPQTGAPLNQPNRPPQDLREIFPQMFLALSSNLGFDPLTLSLTIHTPQAQRYSLLRGEEGPLFDPAAQGPTRYHSVELTQFHLFVSPAISYRVHHKVALGVALNYAYVLTDIGFVRDAALDGGRTRDAGEQLALDDCAGSPCNYGSDAAAEAVRVKGTGWGVGFSAGVLVRPLPSLDVGLGYVSPPMRRRRSMVAEGDAWVRRSAAGFQNALQDPQLETGVVRDLQGRGQVSYSMPDMVHLGAVWRTSPQLLLDLQLRWINFSAYELVDIRLTGTQLRARPQVVDRIVQHRGFQDVYSVQLGAAWRVVSSLQLQGAAMLETSAVPEEAVSAAALDSIKLDAFVALRWSIGQRLSLSAGYGLVLMPALTVSRSVFSPSDAVSCVEARYDMDLPACRRAAAGQAVASAAGTYNLTQHRFGMSVAYDIW